MLSEISFFEFCSHPSTTRIVFPSFFELNFRDYSLPSFSEEKSLADLAVVSFYVSRTIISIYVEFKTSFGSRSTDKIQVRDNSRNSRTKEAIGNN